METTKVIEYIVSWLTDDYDKTNMSVFAAALIQ